MYDIAAQVGRWQEAGLPVTIARVVEVTGLSSRFPDEALAVAPGEPWAGRVLAGAVDARLAETLGAAPAEGRLVEVAVGDDEAHGAGLACGGLARLLVQPASDVPPGAWQALHGRRPLGLVTDLAGPRVGRTTWFPADSPGTDEAHRLVAQGVSATARVGDALVAALWPTPRLLVAGDGLLADALRGLARSLGWEPLLVADATAADVATALTPADAVVVLSHDRAIDGPVLAAAVAGDAAYVGALGSRHTQALRREWLAAHGVPADAVARIHGPAGLDVGARTPAEIAVAIVAEILAVRSGTTAVSLRDSGGPIHHDPPTVSSQG